MSINWLCFVQTYTGRIKFVTNEDATYQVLSYNKFRDYIGKFKILNLFDFYRGLDSFQTITLDCNSGEWRIEKPEFKEPTFEEMLKLNPGQQEIEENKKKTDPTLKKKNFIDEFFKARKKQNSIFNVKNKK
jgi:hypothetical protein